MTNNIEEHFAVFFFSPRHNFISSSSALMMSTSAQTEQKESARTNGENLYSMDTRTKGRFAENANNPVGEDD
jgi:hypothetical protein